uniref:60S ribosomal export protein NMD3 n=1 Tax=Chlamydomonas euryale TaxID=1486919 RepID=A0A6U2GZ91_9CHLO|mmetsp:Transcript_3669/g.10315  ORF Transcript_3669/g.10315 Transcript_3669/m.10315 type:complete len:569 (+) Transcript_3669:407-2113(+)
MQQAGFGGSAATAAPMQTFVPQATQGMVLCCLCGTSIPSNPSNMCVNCIRSQVDITEGVQKQVTVLWCKMCGRYLQPPKHWVRAEPESKELLTFCIKKIKGLSKVKLVDAGFIWTEPHSKRLKIKLTVQGEVFNGAILQQTFVVDFVVENNMCMECNRANANPNSWTACVQLRQHVYHKRTFLFLEQLIMKHGADVNCVKITDIHEGVDFFFANRAHACKLVDFLQSVVPVRFRTDKQLVSHDTHNNTYNYKYTFSVEIIPVCKDDLVFLPAKVSSSLGQMGPLVLCTKVSNQLTLLDPVTMRTATMDAPVYYRVPFGTVAVAKQMTEYVVLDIEVVRDGPPVPGKSVLAEATVARVSDFGRNDTVFYTRTHLGNLLHPGDTALGYDLINAQLVGLDYDAFVAKGGTLPDVVLVRKSYEERRRRRRAKGIAQRPWKLKRLDMEVGESVAEGGGGARGARGRAALHADAADEERERFLQELEEDPEMRQRINLYKDPEAIAALASARAAGPPPGLADGDDDGMGSDDDDEDLPQIPLEELLDDLEALQLAGQGDGDDGADHSMDADMEG